MQTIKLADGGLLFFIEHFYDESTADRLFSAVRDTSEWGQKKAIFGHFEPRLTASYGEDGVVYRYSKTVNVALPWTIALEQIKDDIEQYITSQDSIHLNLGADENKSFNYCLLNRYRNGSDSMGWHADNELGLGSTIASLSFGGTRTFRIRHNQTKEKMAFHLSHGSLLIMAGTMQKFWQHDIPKTKAIVPERINLTFRDVDQTVHLAKNF